jgi:hypothetical protein
MRFKNVSGQWAAALLAALWILPAAGDVIWMRETWDEDDAGWAGATSEMTLEQSAFGGGTLKGLFLAQTVPTAEVGGFRATSASSGGAHVGDYWASPYGFSGWRFDFYAADVLPSSLYVRFYDGANTFQANLLDQITATAQWTALTTPGPAFGVDAWIGPGGAAGLSNALAQVQWIELRVERNNVGSQSFYLDNFQQVVPEPGALLLCLAGGGLLSALRGRRIGAPQGMKRASIDLFGLVSESVVRSKRKMEEIS